MFTTLISTSVLAGAIALGSAGAASASTSVTPGATPAPTSAVRCQNATEHLQQISTRQAKDATRLTKLQANEAKARQKGRPALAVLIQDRIAVANQLAVILDQRATRIETACHLSAGGTATVPTTG